MKNKKIIYLANKFGFSDLEKKLVLPKIVKKLEEMNLEVWEPFTRNNQMKYASNKETAYYIGQKDKEDTEKADAIFAVINGVPPDEGVMVELGIAIALKKPTFLFHDDFRRATDSEKYPLNLMIFTGLPQYHWQDYYYTSIEEISDSNKALSKWAADV